MSDLFNFENTEVVSLDELVQESEIELGRGNVISKIDIRENPGKFPIYSSSAQRNGKMGEYGNYMFDEELITWSVDGGGRFFYRKKHKYSVTNVCGYMRIKSGKSFDYRYLHAILDYQHRRLRFDYQTKAHPSVIRQLYEIPRLRLSEQKKIAEILSAVDEVIENTESEINKLEDLKKATLNELLTKGIGHTEFKESEIGRIPRSWEVKQLGECLFSKPQYGANASARQWKSGEPRYLRITDISVDGTLNTDGIVGIDLEDYTEYLVECGDVLIARSGNTVGKSYFHDNPSVKLAFAGYLLRLRTNKQILVPKYLAEYLHSSGFWHWVEQKARVAAQPNINGAEYAQMLVPLPPLIEQEHIVKVSESLTVMIHEKKSAVRRHTHIKQALMQDLLSGKMRVKVN